jgi:REP element-mobilizing transposase RayT
MSNHYHLVIRLAPDQAINWSDGDVLQRWCSLFKGPVLVRRCLNGETLSPAEQTTVDDIASVYRERLKSLSWYMKCLNETIARMANAEDQCTGHFWEARFHSVPLRTDAAVIQAMAYVDLNPIRAGIAETPEASDYTSFKARTAKTTRGSQVEFAIHALYERGELLHTDIVTRPLMAFADQPASDPGQRLPIGAADYGVLVDELARCIAPGKQGRMTENLPSIIERLGLSSDDWMESVSVLPRS